MSSDYCDLFGSLCYIEPNDGCIKSHPEAGAVNGGDYDLDGICTFKAKQSGLLHVTHFDTEDGWDILAVGGIEYSGFSGPEGVFIEAGDTLLRE